jgi:hypothetical protein
LLSDEAFHNTGVPPLNPRRPERGRAEAVHRVLADAVTCLGPFSDARPEHCVELRFIAHEDPTMLGAFRMPRLRNVTERAPYTHAGQLASLENVVSLYANAPAAAVGPSELVQGGAVQGDRGPSGSAARRSQSSCVSGGAQGPSSRRRSHERIPSTRAHGRVGGRGSAHLSPRFCSTSTAR